MRLCVFEDAGVANLEPLSLTRPAFDLWLGAGTQLDRIRRLFGYTEQPNLPARYNIAPTQPVPVVLAERDARKFMLMRWAFLPAGHP